MPNTENILWSFWGTDEFSVKVLNTLVEAGLKPDFIITAPDKPKGRKLILTPPPVKVWAETQGVPFVQPTSLKEELPFLHRPFDFSLVASYGKIIPKPYLEAPKHGTLNVHPSLLPLYRGATPLESAILAGDKKTGVTLMLMDEEMDHGSILAQESIDLQDWQPYYEELRDETAKIGAKLLLQSLEEWLNYNLPAIPQDHDQATYTKKITKENGLINFEDQPEVNYRKIRAFTPWPGAYFFIKHNNRDFRIIIKKARLENDELIIEKVIPEGKGEMDWESFRRGYLKNRDTN